MDAQLPTPAMPAAVSDACALRQDDAAKGYETEKCALRQTNHMQLVRKKTSAGECYDARLRAINLQSRVRRQWHATSGMSQEYVSRCTHLHVQTGHYKVHERDAHCIIEKGHLCAFTHAESESLPMGCARAMSLPRTLLG
jgi:hypothetical protein